MTTPVLVVTNAYPDYEGSYHGIFVERAVRDLAGRGWLSHVLVPRIFKASRRRENLPTHTVTRFPFPTKEKLLIEYESVPVFRLSVLLCSGTLAAARLVLSRRCRLIHAHWAFPAGLIGLAAARLTGRPLLLTVHGSDWRLARTRGGAAALLFARVARGASRIISVSKEITDYLLELGIPGEKVFTRPMGADERIFYDRKSSPAGQLRAGLSIISTRNLLPLYRVEDVIRAAAETRERLPGMALTIAGEGRQREELEALCRGLGIAERVTFTGRLEPQQLAERLSASRVYVSASPAEGTSVSLLEALACGCLPVVTDIPANREWVAHGENGLLFRPGNIEELSACLVRAAEDTGLAERAAARGPEIVARRGSWSGQLELIDKLYGELMTR
ncbi:MAG: hypothetical protein A3F83_03965 [Candidatus Glassbacteria bacterium RIFCSPLOWO2_12_FULL_58_11]|uniref:Glycosyltransferase subfamily 4-like N-terminal domain-containing protein n=1 Tax=Candidatus Glassbacteria bacterium RIFCSPLOWO2_12_FULL_58_11 TaxID=1817867 RepID=A0A1F5Z040_9BACT|nr:MAG: hypothetical protein A3F83_03965 [Candidatus Glassbacteria bacterium RIFCSPLOWO2_12_FULL_58_11]